MTSNIENQRISKYDIHSLALKGTKVELELLSDMLLMFEK